MACQYVAAMRSEALCVVAFGPKAALGAHRRAHRSFCFCFGDLATPYGAKRTTEGAYGV